MLDNVLGDRFNQRVVRDGLDEDGAVVVAWSGGYVYLQGQRRIFLQQAVVDVLNGLEPGHVGIVDVMSYVVEDRQLFDIANDDAQVDLGIGSGSGGAFAEKVVHGVFVVGRRWKVVAGVNTVDVGEKDVACLVGDTNVVLDVEGQLEIVAPVVAIEAVVRQNRVVFQENAKALKILVDAVKDDDVRGDDQEVAGES